MPSPIKLISICVLVVLFGFFLLSTAFCDQQSDVSISNMSGVLSIGPDGNIYIQFTESHAKFTVGNLIMGKIPEELTLAQADQHELQKAAYLAYNAWLKCQIAKKKAADGKITSVQMEYECARYSLYSAEEVLAGTKAILDNGLGSEINWAEPVYEISQVDYENAKQEEQHALDLGAVPIAEGYQPPGEGLAAGFTPPINTSDPNIDTGKYILDTVPIKDTLATSPSTP